MIINTFTMSSNNKDKNKYASEEFTTIDISNLFEDIEKFMDTVLVKASKNIEPKIIEINNKLSLILHLRGSRNIPFAKLAQTEYTITIGIGRKTNGLPCATVHVYSNSKLIDIGNITCEYVSVRNDKLWLENKVKLVICEIFIWLIDKKNLNIKLPSDIMSTRSKQPKIESYGYEISLGRLDEYIQKWKKKYDEKVIRFVLGNRYD